MDKNYILGIDIGSVSISIVIVDKERQIVQSSYLFHEGQIIQNLKAALSDYKLKNINAVSITSSTPQIINYSQRFDNRVCFIQATKELFPEAEALQLREIVLLLPG
jgi:activator of 2-hydroxyglutaryl-CoA dehydratase